jgi:hypothetical protein
MIAISLLPLIAGRSIYKNCAPLKFFKTIRRPGNLRAREVGLLKPPNSLQLTLESVLRNFYSVGLLSHGADTKLVRPLGTC